MHSLYQNIRRSVLILGLAGLLAAPAQSAVLYNDDFDDGRVARNFRSINGAVLTESGGKLNIDIQAPGQGFAFDFTVDGIGCLEMAITDLQSRNPLRGGDTITWKWVVRDIEDGTEYPLLQSEWTHLPVPAALSGSANQLSAKDDELRTRAPQDPVRTVFQTWKTNKAGQRVRFVQAYDKKDVNHQAPKGKTVHQGWDVWPHPSGTGEIVQCEISLKDKNGKVCKYLKLFPADDPPSFSSVSIEVTSDFPMEINLDSVTGSEEHPEHQGGIILNVAPDFVVE